MVFPLRAFGNGGAGELIDGGILAQALMHPITAGINASSLFRVGDLTGAT